MADDRLPAPSRNDLRNYNPIPCRGVELPVTGTTPRRSAKMESIGSFVFLAFAAAFGLFALWHEIRWRNRLRAWERTTGKVVGHTDGRPINTLFGGKASSDDGPYPEIAFSWRGSAHKFVSGYGGSGLPRIGSEVDVLYDPATGNAEYLSITNRWLGTILPAIFSAMFSWVTFQQ